MTSHLTAWCLLLATFSVFCQHQDTEKKAIDDKRLLAKVMESVEKKIAIEKIEDFVGQKATINTIRKGDDNVWSVVKIVLDKKESEVKTLRGSVNAVYWVRHLESPQPKIVGVVWTKSSEMKVFFGEVLPP